MGVAPIRKVVLPVAGLGTRVLPATKSIPKEMLTVVDRPLIDYAIEEAREAGIEEFIFVTGRAKEAIENYFDHMYELEDTLERKKKTKQIDALAKTVPLAGNAVFTRQQKPLGLGHAIWCARHIVGNEPFAISLPDMLVDAQPSGLAQLVKAYNDSDGANIIAVEEVPQEHTDRYGIIDTGETRDGLIEIKGLVEKPAPDKAPSNLAILGRYILRPEIFSFLEDQKPGAGNEIQLTDAMARMIGNSPFYGAHYEGTTYDCGDKFGYLEANIGVGLKHADLGDKVKDLVKRLAQ
ncbi:MAG: UTP--glucose-1-phosphate uridylyltransferase GalU [Alphaproteobacteria bacterium]